MAAAAPPGEGAAWAAAREALSELAEEHLDLAATELEAGGWDGAAQDLRTAVRTAAETSPLSAHGQASTPAADAIVAEAWGLLQAGGWPQPCWREAYVLAQLCRALALGSAAAGASARAIAGEHANGDDGAAAAGAAAAEALAALDLCFIMGAPEHVVQALVDVVEPLVPRADSPPPTGLADAVVPPSTSPAAADAWLIPSGPLLPGPRVPALDPARAIARVSGSVDPTRFRTEFFRKDKPVVLEGLAVDWPAFRTWGDLRTWVHRFGHRTVPVELGVLRGDTAGGTAGAAGGAGGGTALPEVPAPSSPGASPPRMAAPASAGAAAGPLGVPASSSAAATAWAERPILLADLIRQYLVPSNAAPPDVPVPVAYLAQHALVAQLPALAEDFEVPDVCGPPGGQTVNAWMGTRGTITPAHFDSFDNILTQVAGYKYVRLYSAAQGALMYCDAPGARAGGGAEGGAEGGAGGGGLRAQRNVSRVDVEAPDLLRFPRFAEAEYTDVILGPGDGLYIPARCWHYVRSLTTSVSLSFFF